MAPPAILDSRRLTGPGLLLDRPGAAFEVHLPDETRDRAVEAWSGWARRLLDAVGWTGERLAVRLFPGGASLALTAPPDALYAATTLNELAWEISQAELRGEPAPALDAEVERLRRLIARERNPRLLALRDAARARGLTFLADDEAASAGSGTGTLVWPLSALPDPKSVDWGRAHDVPIVLVTGSNGKTTVTRLLAAMASEAGRVAGHTSTDGVVVGGETVAAGDYAGPEGARLLLRRPEVETAVLETARGGILRRGLTVERADVAVVTNIAADHLGEYGVVDLPGLALAKLVTAQAVGSEGAVVLNADDPLLAAAEPSLRAPVIWFSLEQPDGRLAAHLASGGKACLVEGGVLVLAQGSERWPLAPVTELPITVGGAARHNVANALAAVGGAAGLGLTAEVIGRALRRFGRNTTDNLGRAAVLEAGGARVVVDYAHNPHGMAALVALAGSLPARRRLILLGQAGDRSDQAIRDLARAAFALRPDRVIAKEMAGYLRGRRPGEVPALLAGEFRRLGVPENMISTPGSEIAGVQEALAWAGPGDLLVLALHEARSEVLALLGRLAAAGWRAGDPLPM